MTAKYHNAPKIKPVPHPATAAPNPRQFIGEEILIAALRISKKIILPTNTIFVVPFRNIGKNKYVVVNAKRSAWAPGAAYSVPHPVSEVPIKLQAASIPGFHLPSTIVPGTLTPTVGAMRLPNNIAMVSPKTYTNPLKFALNREPNIAMVGMIIGHSNTKNLI